MFIFFSGDEWLVLFRDSARCLALSEALVVLLTPEAAEKAPARSWDNFPGDLSHFWGKTDRFCGNQQAGLLVLALPLRKLVEQSQLDNVIAKGSPRLTSKRQEDD